MKTRTLNAGTVTTAATTGPMLNANEKRVGLLLSPATPNRYSIGIGTDAVLDAGVTINPGTAQIWLWKHDVGPMICSNINIISTGAEQVGFLEVVES